jgi:hypothetical protein
MFRVVTYHTCIFLCIIIDFFAKGVGSSTRILASKEIGESAAEFGSNRCKCGIIHKIH